MKANAQLLETGQIVQVACPLTGKPVNKEATVEAGDTKVGVLLRELPGEVRQRPTTKAS